jgi:hypothetical protein
MCSIGVICGVVGLEGSTLLQAGCFTGQHDNRVCMLTCCYAAALNSSSSQSLHCLGERRIAIESMATVRQMVAEMAAAALHGCLGSLLAQMLPAASTH